MLHRMDTSLWLLPALLIAIAFAAPRYGVDSRDGYDWNRRFGPPDPLPPMASRRRSTPAADLAALGRLIRRVDDGWVGQRAGNGSSQTPRLSIWTVSPRRSRRSTG
jgi:hypothetical protein